MPPFITDNFLLQNEAARALYHSYAKPQPILDYHCHLSAKEIAANRAFKDLSEIWLGGDHYKWRALRANGVEERLCTGDASPREKFDAWVATVPYTLRNPLYHWSHLELARYFDLYCDIKPENADQIWEAANSKLPSLTPRAILEKCQVAALCTTDDPADSLEHHEAIARSGIRTKVYPTFRPDAALAVDRPEFFRHWISKLETVSGISIKSLDQLLEALEKRHADFHAIGCRLSDHGLEQCYATPCTPAEAKAVFDKAREAQPLAPEEIVKYRSFLMLEFGRWDAKRGWTKQLHLGAMRNNNTRMLNTIGPDTGYDSIGDYPQAQTLSRYLNALNLSDELPRVILYNLNPADNYVLATMIGNFQDGSIPGKIQFGSGWWFLDQAEGMRWQLDALSSLGLLRRFVGMLTDSRSFLSYPRHEYFRRVLCDLLGADMEAGRLPKDMALIGKMVEEICFTNARDYFGFELHPDFQ